MIILFEWCITICLLFLSLGKFFGDNYNGYYSYDNNFDTELGLIYFIGFIVAFIVSMVHTSIYDDNSNYVRPHRYDWSALNNKEERHERYMPQNNNTRVTVVTTTSQTNSWTFKTTQEVIKDIIKDYPKNTTTINEVKQNQVVKKKTFFDFGKKEEPKTYIVPKNAIETEQDFVSIDDAMDEFDVTPDFCFIDTNTTYLTHEREEIYRALSIAIMEYVPSDLRNIVNNNIVHIEQTLDNINIFYRPSKAIDMKRYLNRNSLIASMRKRLKINEFGKIKFIEIKDPSFVEFYSENYGNNRCD